MEERKEENKRTKAGSPGCMLTLSKAKKGGGEGRGKKNFFLGRKRREEREELRKGKEGGVRHDKEEDQDVTEISDERLVINLSSNCNIYKGWHPPSSSRCVWLPETEPSFCAKSFFVAEIAH